MTTRPVTADGRVYLGVADALNAEGAATSFSLAALEAASGDVIWRTSLPGRPLPDLVAADGTVYSVHLGTGVLAVDAGSGGVRWTAGFPVAPESLSPARLSTSVLVVRGTDSLRGHDRARGAARREFPGSWELAPLVEDDVVYAARSANTERRHALHRHRDHHLPRCARPRRSPSQIAGAAPPAGYGARLTG